MLLLHFSDNHKGNEHRQDDKLRCEEEVVFPLVCCGRRPQAAQSQPVHYYCTWPLCALGDPAWEPWPSPQTLPTYVRPVTQGHSCCQRKFTTCMNNNLKCSYSSTSVSRETKQRVGVSQGPPGFDLFVHMWSNIVNYQLFKELIALQISWIQCYLYGAKSLSYIFSRQINIVRLRPQKL